MKIKLGLSTGIKVGSIGVSRSGAAVVAPPAAPTGLTATPASTSQINLAWTDAATDETAYRVYRSTDGSTYAQVGTDLAAGSTSYNDTSSIAAGTKYYYKVAAVNAGGETLSAAVTANTLTLSISAYWNLNETSDGSGNVNRVDSVSGLILASVNTVASGTGKAGNCVQLVKANSEELTIADDAKLSVTSDTTWACWAYMDTKEAALMAIINKEPNNFTTGEWEIDYLNSSDRFRFTMINTTNNAFTAVANNLGSPSAETWYLIVCTFTQATGGMTIQVNNGTANTATLTGTARDGSVTFRVGSQNVSGRYWNGRIDEVGIWKRVLTAAEKTALYNGGNGTTYPF